VIRRNLRHSDKGVSIAGDINAVIAANVNEPGSSHVSASSTQRSDERGASMTDQERQPDLTDEELQAEAGEELPDREAMSLINANVAAPVNAAVALNVLSDDSVAIANAEQTGTIDQST
jgi:hypothetical protein